MFPIYSVCMQGLLLANPFKHFPCSFFAADWFNLQIDFRIEFRRVCTKKNEPSIDIFSLNSYSAFSDWKCKSRQSTEAEGKTDKHHLSLFFAVVESIIQFEISCLFNKNECFPIRFSPEMEEFRDNRMTEIQEKRDSHSLQEGFIRFPSVFGYTWFNRNNFMRYEKKGLFMETFR